jgi:hypothetical protein
MEIRLSKFVATLIVTSLWLATPSAATNVPRFASEDEQRSYIKEQIVKHFPHDYDVMLAIAYCESRKRPFIHWEADGSLRPHDTGASSAAGTFQVLLKLHSQAIRDMGLDMNNLDDYLTFVDRLRKESPGYGAWNESRTCWESRIGSIKR